MHEQMWLSIHSFMSKCEYQHGDLLPSIATWGYRTKCEFNHGDTQPSKNVNIHVYDQVWISTWASLKNCQYQHGDTWPREKNKITNVTKCEVPHSDTCPSVNIYMGINDQGIIATWRGNTLQSQKGNMVIHDQVIIASWGIINKCEYQHNDARPTENIKMWTYD